MFVLFAIVVNELLKVSSSSLNNCPPLIFVTVVAAVLLKFRICAACSVPAPIPQDTTAALLPTDKRPPAAVVKNAVRADSEI
ncbi:hypothetical protein D3C80_1926230 [compost metagenome]